MAVIHPFLKLLRNIERPLDFDSAPVDPVSNGLADDAQSRPEIGNRKTIISVRKTTLFLSHSLN